MKTKCLALLLAGVMCFGGCVTVMGSETESTESDEVYEFDSSMITEEYTFHYVNDLFELYFPVEWDESSDLEDVDDSIEFAAINSDGTEAIGVYYYADADYETLADLEQAIYDEEYTTETQCIFVNDIPCVRFVQTDNDIYWHEGIAILLSDGTYYKVIPSCSYDIADEFAEIDRNIWLSVTLCENEEGTEE